MVNESVLIPTKVDITFVPMLIQYRLERNGERHGKCLVALFTLCLIVNNVTLWGLIEAIVVSLFFWCVWMTQVKSESEDEMLKERATKREIALIKKHGVQKCKESPV